MTEFRASLLLTTLGLLVVQSAAKPSVLTDVGSNISNAFQAIGKEIQHNTVVVNQPIAETLSAALSAQCDILKKILGISYEQLEANDREPDLNDLTIEYRDPEIRTIYNINTAAERIPKSSEYDLQKPLCIFIHGFTSDASSDAAVNSTEALLRQGYCNALALDGSSLIKRLYLRSTTYVRFIGEKLAQVLLAMTNAGLDPSDIHIIGHSLGAHISGFTGKTFTNLTGLKVGRISGLDPAGPCFAEVVDELRLKSTDGDFVDIIHTDAGVLGMKEAIGQVDYFPNGGTDQPDCDGNSCNHGRSWQYFLESILIPGAFPAVRCKDYDAFKKGECDEDISYMGYSSEAGTTGQYYLQTSGASPYGRGVSGTQYVKRQTLFKTLFS